MADNENCFVGENNTGHIWDADLRELSNPPPRWWTIAFWISMGWVVVYAILYPMIPYGQEATKGVLGWTQMKEYHQGMAEIEAVRAPFEERIAQMSAAEILADDGLASYVVASSKVLYGDFCSACHGSGGMGGPGYPVLADDEWLWGGTIEAVVTSITNGRRGVMTAHGKILNDEEINSLAQSVIARDVASNPLYMSKGCIACHGMDGGGMAILGAPSLVDTIYRFLPEEGETQLESVKYTIRHGVNDPSDPNTREAEMPAFRDRLSESDIKKLAVYVHRMGGGQ